jgi:hypothetical protein
MCVSEDIMPTVHHSQAVATQAATTCLSCHISITVDSQVPSSTRTQCKSLPSSTSGPWSPSYTVPKALMGGLGKVQSCTWQAPSEH